MKPVSEFAVLAAAALLPRGARARYREQWLGELRDASEAGIRTSDIAVGSLAFAATFDRPPPSRRRPSPDTVRRRARLAAGLALGAALVALTGYADIAGGRGLGGSAVGDFSRFVATTMLSLYALVAPALSLGLVMLTRGISVRIRIAVLLLALVGLAPVTQAAIDGRADTADIYLGPGAGAYVIATVAAIVAVGLLRTGLRPPAPSVTRRLVVGAVAALLVAAIAYAAVGNFLDLTNPGSAPAVPAEPLMLVSRWTIVAVTLATVGRVRPGRRDRSPSPEEVVVAKRIDHAST